MEAGQSLLSGRCFLLGKGEEEQIENELSGDTR